MVNSILFRSIKTIKTLWMTLWRTCTRIVPLPTWLWIFDGLQPGSGAGEIWLWGYKQDEHWFWSCGKVLAHFPESNFPKTIFPKTIFPIINFPENPFPDNPFPKSIFPKPIFPKNILQPIKTFSKKFKNISFLMNFE